MYGVQTLAQFVFTQGTDMSLHASHPTHSVPNCKVAKSGLTVQCKDTAVKLK